MEKTPDKTLSGALKSDPRQSAKDAERLFGSENGKEAQEADKAMREKRETGGKEGPPTGKSGGGAFRQSRLSLPDRTSLSSGPAKPAGGRSAIARESRETAAPCATREGRYPGRRVRHIRGRRRAFVRPARHAAGGAIREWGSHRSNGTPGRRPTTPDAVRPTGRR